MFLFVRNTRLLPSVASLICPFCKLTPVLIVSLKFSVILSFDSEEEVLEVVFYGEKKVKVSSEKKQLS